MLLTGDFIAHPLILDTNHLDFLKLPSSFELGSGVLGRVAEWPWRGFAAIFGGFLLQFTMVSTYCFEN